MKLHYYINLAATNANSVQQENGSDPRPSCTPTKYTGEICKSTFLGLQHCILNQSIGGNINISAVNQHILEQMIMFGVGIHNLSQECKAVLIPFLCQYLLTPCDERGIAYYPSLEDCVYIRDQVCAVVWDKVVRIPDQLPSCESLPVESVCKPGELLGAIHLHCHVLHKQYILPRASSHYIS